MRHYSAAFSRPQLLRFYLHFLQCLYSCYYVLYGKSEVWEQFAVRSGCTKTIHSDHIAVKTYITIPSKSRKCLYCNSLSYILWKNLCLILLRLLLEDIHTWHGYDTNVDSILC